MPADLTAPEARAERDALAHRTDVLDKVGVLRTLPDDLHVTTDMVASFYEVPIETIKTVVKRNREELDDDGLTVIDREDFALRFNLNPGRVSAFMLYPRRAVLRIAMVLRDSPVARQVRDYLLDAERPAGIPDITTPSGLLVMTEMFRDTARQLVAATEQINRDRPLVERAKTHAAGEGDRTRQQFFRELKQWAQDAHGVTVKQADVMVFLSTAKLGLFTRGNRVDSGNATAWAIEKGYARNPEDTAANGHNYIRPVLTPAGMAYAWERCVRYIDANGTITPPHQIGIA